MPTTSLTPVKKLKLDLANFRTVPQPNETSAIQAMISISPGPFWALMMSLIEDGYLPTENILVQKGSDSRETLTTKEGNRRVAALKLIHGLIPIEEFSIPDNIRDKIQSMPHGWKTANSNVPCAIYEPAESKKVERIRALTHGKGEKAGRDGWESVARARHNRAENEAIESGLDLLEKYLVAGKNVTEAQKLRWSGDYPLTVLDEAIKRIASRFEVKSARELAQSYPKVKYRDSIEKIIHEIGLKNIGFDAVRNTDLATAYGVPPDKAAQKAGSTENKGAKTKVPSGSGGIVGDVGGVHGSNVVGLPKKLAAVAINDPRQVARILKQFKPLGNRPKVVTLLEEIRTLKLDKNPIAFCFLLRSMFEISAKHYCDDHKHKPGAPSLTKQNGEQKILAEVLKEITKHLTGGNSKSAEGKALHGAITELATPTGLLSVTSMNQLVHNKDFSIAPSSVALLFGNIFPLLEAMNK